MDDNSRMENSIVERLENSLDQRSVGGDGYGLSKAINDKMDQLITKLTSPVALPPSPPDESLHNTLLGKIVDSIHCDVLQEEEEDVFTLELDNELHKRAHAAVIHEKTNEQLKQRKRTVFW